jgi:putative phage-type endonuclease
MLTAEQLELRRTGIGSSDIAALAELDPHRGPIDVWLDKMGLAETSESPAMWAGDRLEEAVAAMYCEQHHAVLYKPTQTSRHPTSAIALATPDRLALQGPAPMVEIKVVGRWMADRWGDPPHEAPVDKILQVQWQLEVLQLDREDIAALIGGTDLRVYRVERDRELGADMLALAETFWREHIIARVAPPHDGTLARALAAMQWPRNNGAMLPATLEAEVTRDRLLRLGQLRGRIEDAEARLQAKACAMVGEADGVDGCFTWKAPRVSWRDRAMKAAMKGAEETFLKIFEQETAFIGRDEDAWKEMALKLGAPPMQPTRRFLVKRPKQ